MRKEGREKKKKGKGRRIDARISKVKQRKKKNVLCVFFPSPPPFFFLCFLRCL